MATTFSVAAFWAWITFGVLTAAIRRYRQASGADRRDGLDGSTVATCCGWPELAGPHDAYADMASKFLEHYLAIADAAVSVELGCGMGTRRHTTITCSW